MEVKLVPGPEGTETFVLAQQYWRAAGAFDVTIQRRRGGGKARLKVSWKRDTRWSDWAALSEGCYLLRTNLTETDPATLWKRYIQLTEAEWAFRISKDELEIPAKRCCSIGWASNSPPTAAVRRTWSNVVKTLTQKGT